MMILRIAAILLALAALTACSTPGAERPFGQAYTEQFNQQVAFEPYAAPTPVTGLDGHLARRASERTRNPEADKGPSFNEVMKSLLEKK